MIAGEHGTTDKSCVNKPQCPLDRLVKVVMSARMHSATFSENTTQHI